MKTIAKLLIEKNQGSVWNVSPETSVIDALYLMADKKIGALPVVENEKLVGIFSERDYARKGIIQGRKAKETKVSELMTAKVISVSPTHTIQNCMEIFSEMKFRHLPVLDGDKIVGMLSVGDIVNSIIKDQREHIDYLEQYIRN